MAKPEWGFKRICLSCGAKFYDMQRTPIVCPACETVFDPDAATKLKRGRQQPVEQKPKAAEKTKSDDQSTDDDDFEDDLDDDMDDDGVLEDTSDLDNDDVPVVGGDGEDDDT